MRNEIRRVYSMPKQKLQKNYKLKTKQIKPELPGGFRDYGPREAIARTRMIATIRRVFESFGFDPMETPAVERTEVLTGGERNSKKIIFNVRGSKDLSIQAGKKSDTSLRFDLTVPLARFLAANPGIPKPFKRYQIGNVWRGERQQAGRYREFLQMDFDIIGTTSLDADAEIIRVMYEVMQALDIENFFIKMNNKAEAMELLNSIGVSGERAIKTLVAIDKKDKLDSRAWEKEVKNASGLGASTLKEYLWKISGENMLETTQTRTLRAKAEQLGVPQKYLIYDASLVRGLGYYTGSIFEAVLTDFPSIGTVMGGGRFDGLTKKFSPESLPAVGVSIGIDRLFAALEKLRGFPQKETVVDILVMNLLNDASAYQEFEDMLRSAGMNVALYIGDDKAFQAQLAYAVKKGIPYVLIYGDREKEKGTVTIKNLKTREQKEMPKEKISRYFAK